MTAPTATDRAPGLTRRATVDAATVVILLVAAVLSLAVQGPWSRPRARQVLLVLCWLVAVG
jgi:hypothetical protein